MHLLDKPVFQGAGKIDLRLEKGAPLSEQRRRVALQRHRGIHFQIDIHIVTVAAFLGHAPKPVLEGCINPELGRGQPAGQLGLQQPTQSHDIQGFADHLPGTVAVALLPIGVQLPLPSSQPVPARIEGIDDGVGGVGPLVSRRQRGLVMGTGINGLVVHEIPIAVGMRRRQHDVDRAVGCTRGDLQAGFVLDSNT